uniref:7A protein n=1 Tax=Melon necrotic spot virus TaxID=11987 RepID=A0A224AM58_MNSV|nr:7A protein [Melon necrotic spot virus]
MDSQRTVEQQNPRGRSRDRDDGGGKQKNSMGRKIADDPITESKQGVMGASVYIADKIKVNINFNF